ncbi:MAG: hypothetical protein A2X12_02260 [Bacteroidetes bacterium GWE2_29_8]|nr:MAG: hypothetical protein A2X12_02260 [Bacteroidetes bacterium GWE2_29_8]OFY19170.1 MAG: hypothetical protein A2X02_01630 [Bacteroidetes bacterium GWF2_29_10]
MYKYLKEHPLRFSLILGLVIRLIAVIFSKGYGMHDDHYLVIETAQSWVEGLDYNNWLPENSEIPSGHSWLYPLINYVHFLFFDFIGVDDPQLKMLLIRLILSVYSLSIIYYTFKIVNKISGIEIATKVTVLTSLLWFMPFLSVRNLVEIIAIPPLMYSVWFFVKHKTDNNIKFYVLFFVGFIAGISFSIRYQTLIFLGGIGLVLLFNKDYKRLIYWGIGIILSIFAFQGLIDYIIWGMPFSELKQYFIYNIDNAYNYETNVWYSYLLLLGGIFVPPFGLIIMFYFFKNYKKYLLLFVPTLLFLIFHSYFPNKQERFILTIVPFYSIIGMVGFFEYIKENGYNKFYRISFIFFIIINMLLLPIITTTYSKKSMVDAMYFFYNKKENIESIIVENTNKENLKLMPIFYSGKRFNILEFSSKTIPVNKEDFVLRYHNHPSYILFIEDKNLEQRVSKIKKLFPHIQLKKIIEPSLIDEVLHRLNPKNDNQTIYIYQIV